MANTPLRRRAEIPVEKPKPKIWAEGGQRPPFDIRALGRASFFLSRTGVAPLHAWAARTARRVSVNVKNGAGRIPAEKLGRAAPYVPSHLRVAAWIKNLATVLAHASANADPEVRRGNALVAEIEPHLWPEASTATIAPAPVTAAASTAEPGISTEGVETAEAAAPETGAPETEPVVLPEPMQPEDDPLASIRDEIADAPNQPAGRPTGRRAVTPEAPAGPPGPPGPVANGAIQVAGYLIGWSSMIIALPYGLVRALWLYAKGVDLRGIGAED
jgi:hypothetical protein